MIIDCDYCPEKTLVSHEQQIKANLLDQAAGIGPYTSAFVRSLWTDGVFAVANEARQLFGLINTYGAERLEATCKRALFYRRVDFMAIDAILRDDLDRLPLNPYTDIKGKLSTQCHSNFRF
jgi:hypothetical protein